MSFFDEADEPRTAPRRGREPPRRRRPPGDHQAVQIRRAIAIGAIVVLVILAALGIKSCQDSARNSALRNYNDNVGTLIQESNASGRSLFAILSSGGGSGSANRLQNQIDQVRVDAAAQLSRAHALDVPDEMRAAQQNLLTALQMRSDGISDMAKNIQPALGTSTNRDAITALAADTAAFYASDVLYKQYAVRQIVAALNATGIPVGGTNGETIEGGQFLPALGWLMPSFLAAKLGAKVAGLPAAKPAPGLHGHSLDSVSVGGTTLQTGSSNSVPASPPATFTVAFTNGGTNNEASVIVKVVVSGTSIQAQTVVPQTTAGRSASAQVTLPKSPPAGTYTVTATVEPVPGEKNTQNNSMSFPVTFG